MGKWAACVHYYSADKASAIVGQGLHAVNKGVFYHKDAKDTKESAKQA